LLCERRLQIPGQVHLIQVFLEIQLYFGYGIIYHIFKYVFFGRIRILKRICFHRRRTAEHFCDVSGSKIIGYDKISGSYRCVQRRRCLDFDFIKNRKRTGYRKNSSQNTDREKTTVKFHDLSLQCDKYSVPAREKKPLICFFCTQYA